MKSLQIIALALCLSAPLAHANNEDGHPSKALGITASATYFTMGTAATLYGLKRIKNAWSINNAIAMDELSKPIRSQTENVLSISNELGHGALFVVVGTVFNACGFFASTYTLKNSPECNK